MDRIFPSQPAPAAPELPAALLPYAEAIAAQLQQPATWFVPLNQLATSLVQSKIGGWPYLPLGVPNPLLDEAGDHRFNLLVQLDLADLPAPQPWGLPTDGMLQCFTREVEDVLDEDHRALCCLYYSTILTDPAALRTDFTEWSLDSIDGYAGVPPQGLALAFDTLTTNPVEPGDDAGGLAYLFAGADDPANLRAQLTAYLAAYSDAVPDTGENWIARIAAQYPQTADGYPDFPSPAEGYGFSIPDHQLGGPVAQFWQGDPRLEWDASGQRLRYDRLLLAYDARGNCTQWPVPFLTHDAKIQVFINNDRLAARDFSDLLFHYMA